MTTPKMCLCNPPREAARFSGVAMHRVASRLHCQDSMGIIAWMRCPNPPLAETEPAPASEPSAEALSCTKELFGAMRNAEWPGAETVTPIIQRAIDAATAALRAENERLLVELGKPVCARNWFTAKATDGIWVHYDGTACDLDTCGADDPMNKEPSAENERWRAQSINPIPHTALVCSCGRDAELWLADGDSKAGYYHTFRNEAGNLSGRSSLLPGCVIAPKGPSPIQPQEPSAEDFQMLRFYIGSLETVAQNHGLLQGEPSDFLVRMREYLRSRAGSTDT